MFMATHLTYYLLAYGYGNPRTFDQTPWSGAVLPALNGLGELVVMFLEVRVGSNNRTQLDSVLKRFSRGQFHAQKPMMGSQLTQFAGES